MSFLENLRDKPEHVQKRYSLLISFGITIVIFTFWINSLNIGSEKKESIAYVANNIDAPGKSLVASVGSFFTDIKDMVFGPKKVIYSSVEVKPGRK